MSLSLKHLTILCLTGYVLFFVGNNLFNLTDPDEVFYCLSAKEMLTHHQWLTPYIFDQPQFEKPVFTFWLIQIAYKIFGETASAARFFPALFALLGTIGVYYLGLMGFRDGRKAFLSALLLATSAFFVGMGKTVFTDMIFAVLILYAFVSFMWGYTDPRKIPLSLIGFYLCCALAVLTKGPLGWLIPQVVVVLFLLYQRQIKLLANIWTVVGVLLFLALTLPWYHYMITHYGQAFTKEFFNNDHWRRLLQAEHKGNDHWFFYPVTMIAGLFPWSLFLIASFVDLFKRLKARATTMDYLSLSWILTVFVIFQLAHSKLASYILPMFPALSLVTGNFLGNCLLDQQKQSKLFKLLVSSFALLALLGIAVIAAQKVYVHWLSSILPIYFLSGSLIVLSGIGLSLSFYKDYQKALYVLALSLCPILLTAFMVRADIEGYVSSREASYYIPQRDAGVVLTSKANVRGIRYYTGSDVAVVDSMSQPFFSPHPIPVLDSKDKVLALLKNQPVTYGVIRKRTYQQILRYCANHYKVILMKRIGYDYIIKIESLKV